jgi:2-dehydropantoate 2-reductase
MRIAMFGAGAVGGYFGGRLAQAGHSVVFIARGAHLEAVRRDGLVVRSTSGDFVVRPAEATDTPADAGQVDVVLLAVKAWQVRVAGRSMLPMLGEGSCVVPLQNGVEACDELAAEVGPARVLGGLCRLISVLEAPGHIRHAGVTPRIEFGEPDGRPSARVDALRAAFDAAAGVSAAVPPDVAAAIWEKFLFIAPFSGVGAVTRAPAGVMRTVPETRAMLESAMREVAALAKARGVVLPEDAVARTLSFVDSLPADATASMQRDLMEGRPSELEYQNGAVVRLARQAGVPVAVNAFLFASLLPAEKKARGAGR